MSTPSTPSPTSTSTPASPGGASGPPPAAAAQDQVTLTIDGQPVSVVKGTVVLEAALKLGMDISYFCYHPGLSIAAACRQCLVEIQGNPKLQPSCQVAATEGMKVVSSSPRVLQAREQMLEFTLVNHPIDCPICDKAGECTLQKLYFEWDAKPSRQVLAKVSKNKRVDLGPTIVLDQERCILCTRCIRVCDEVAGEHQLEMAHRGDHQVLTTAPGTVLDNPYSLNTVDVCPVGALTSKDFRFSMRAWELYSTDSVCTGCATGCNVEVHHHQGRIHRLVPRLNPDVNKHWMCDEGRLTYKPVHAGRLAGPTVDGLPARWEVALEAARTRLGAALEADRGAVGVVLSATFTNEDNWALFRLASEFLGVQKIYLGGRPPVPGRADGILRDADVNGNTAGVRAIADALAATPGGPVVKGQDALEADLRAGVLAAVLVLGGSALVLPEDVLAAAAALPALIVLDTHATGLAEKASVALAAADWAEVDGTMTNRQGRVQRLRAAFDPPGQALPAWDIVTRLGKKLGATMDAPSAQAIFIDLAAALGARLPAFAGAEWGRPQRPIQLRFAHSRG